jgi:hypothetical protein
MAVMVVMVTAETTHREFVATLSAKKDEDLELPG